MTITYHQEVERPDKVTNTIPHEILSEELKDFLKESNVVQKKYYFYDNGFFFFLYLDNGDRVDIAVS